MATVTSSPPEGGFFQSFSEHSLVNSAFVISSCALFIFATRASMLGVIAGLFLPSWHNNREISVPMVLTTGLGAFATILPRIFKLGALSQIMCPLSTMAATLLVGQFLSNSIFPIRS